MITNKIGMFSVLFGSGGSGSSSGFSNVEIILIFAIVVPFFTFIFSVFVSSESYYERKLDKFTGIYKRYPRYRNLETMLHTLIPTIFTAFKVLPIQAAICIAVFALIFYGGIMFGGCFLGIFEWTREFGLHLVDYTQEIEDTDINLSDDEEDDDEDEHDEDELEDEQHHHEIENKSSNHVSSSSSSSKQSSFFVSLKSFLIPTSLENVIPDPNTILPHIKKTSRKNKKSSPKLTEVIEKDDESPKPTTKGGQSSTESDNKLTEISKSIELLANVVT